MNAPRGGGGGDGGGGGGGWRVVASVYFGHISS